MERHVNLLRKGDGITPSFKHETLTENWHPRTPTTCPILAVFSPGHVLANMTVKFSGQLDSLQSNLRE